MGMFDYVKFECECPECREPLSGFQSKDGDCVLETVEPEKVRRWYTSCPACKHWIEYGWPEPVDRVPILLKNESLEKDNGESDT